MKNIWLVISAVSGFLVVALGAFGAHGLKEVLDEYGRTIWEKAVLYQMFHTVAIIAVAILQHLFKIVNFNSAGWGFLAGIILFSGSLYILALTGIKPLGAVTPFGGLSFLFGWV